MSARDAVFAGRLADRRAEKAKLDTTIRVLEQQCARGTRRINPDIVERFGVMIAAKLHDKNAKLRQAYVRLLVDRVVVTADRIEIKGSKAALEAAILDRQSAAGRVPSFDREWCRLGDSNT